MPCTEEAAGEVAPTINLGDHGLSLMIATPLFPKNYHHGSDCHWEFVTSDPANNIRLTVLDWGVGSQTFS